MLCLHMLRICSFQVEKLMKAHGFRNSAQLLDAMKEGSNRLKAFYEAEKHQVWNSVCGASGFMHGMSTLPLKILRILVVLTSTGGVGGTARNS